MLSSKLDLKLQKTVDRRVFDMIPKSVSEKKGHNRQINGRSDHIRLLFLPFLVT